MVIFKSTQKKFEGDLKIKLCGKRLYPTERVKYLGVKINTNLSWKCHFHDLSIKLNRANGLYFKARIVLKYLRSTYFAILDFYLSYCCLNFLTSPLFKQNSILNFQNKIYLENILFIIKSLNNLSPSAFNTWFSS